MMGTYFKNLKILLFRSPLHLYTKKYFPARQKNENSIHLNNYQK